jgi:hypothetical protein
MTGPAWASSQELRTFAIVQDYNNHSKHYSPDLTRSKLLSRDGNHFAIHMRFTETKSSPPFSILITR